MSQQPHPEKNRKQYWLNLTLAGAAGQGGCVTLIILLAAVLGGVWLDSRLGTRPACTLGLVIASIPVSIIVMLFIVRSVTSKIKAGLPQKEGQNEEDRIGKDS